MSTDDPFKLDQIGDTTGKLASSMNIMSKRDANSPCGPYVGPLNYVAEVARPDNTVELDRPQATRVSDVSHFKKGEQPGTRPVTPASTATATPSTSDSPESDNEQSSTTRRTM